MHQRSNYSPHDTSEVRFTLNKFKLRALPNMGISGNHVWSLSVMTNVSDNGTDWMHQDERSVHVKAGLLRTYFS